MAVATEAQAPKKGGRGLSFEEKRKRLSEYFLEKVQSYFNRAYPFWLFVCRRTFFN